jgi:hypothetical protein
MTILEERGAFWWNDEHIPPTKLGADSAVMGLLKIENDGRITLDLDGFLPNEAGPLAIFDSRDINKQIQGILKGTGRRVLLVGLTRNGGTVGSNKISYEEYLAMDCLVADSEFADDSTPPIFRELYVELTGFEDWLRLGAIEVKTSTRTLSARYKKPKNAVYKSDDDTLSINFSVEGTVPTGLRASKLSIKETASLTYRRKTPLSLDKMKELYGLVEDLFILLTDSEYCLEWPSLLLDSGTKCRWYFTRLRSAESTSPPRRHESWTNFVQLRDTFGVIWLNWITKRQDFGPGFYLYLGTRRGVKLYPEHHFVNLIWGIESFHRKRHRPAKTNALNKKLRRIIEQIQKTRDRRWLEGRLRYADEPALEQRLFDVFSALPINLDAKRLRAFSKSCADRRNDISHFGGPRPGTTYTEFVIELTKKSQALSTLYHTLLLHEIGVADNILRWWIFDGFRSFPIKANLVEVGLLDSAILKP